MTEEKPQFIRWNDRYDQDEYVFGTEPNDFLKTVADQIAPGSRVLCLADGEGRNGVYLAKLGHEVTSIDMSSVGLRKAERLAEKEGVTIRTIEANIAEYDLGSGEWDCIVSIFFHIPPQVREIIYPRVVSALAPGGLLILESYTPEQLEFKTGGPPVAEYMLTREIVSEAFADLQFRHFETLEREVVEGAGHTGHAAVLQLIAVNP